MVGTYAKKITKSALIRKYAASSPNIGAQGLAALIKEKHDTVVSPAMVSTVLSSDRRRKRAIRQAAKQTAKLSGGTMLVATAKSVTRQPTGVTVEQLIKAKQVSDEIGGLQKARQAIEALSMLIS